MVGCCGRPCGAGVVLGWFLVSAATAEEQQARMGSRLSGVRVGDVMTRNPLVADGRMTLAEFVDRLVMSHRFSGYPLVDAEGRLAGLVTLSRVRQMPSNHWSGTRLADGACPAEGVRGALMTGTAGRRSSRAARRPAVSD